MLIRTSTLAAAILASAIFFLLPPAKTLAGDELSICAIDGGPTAAIPVRYIDPTWRDRRCDSGGIKVDAPGLQSVYQEGNPRTHLYVGLWFTDPRPGWNGTFAIRQYMEATDKGSAYTIDAKSWDALNSLEVTGGEESGIHFVRYVTDFTVHAKPLSDLYSDIPASDMTMTFRMIVYQFPWGNLRGFTIYVSRVTQQSTYQDLYGEAETFARNLFHTLPPVPN
jgi:hypothetical protein